MKSSLVDQKFYICLCNQELHRTYIGLFKTITELIFTGKQATKGGILDGNLLSPTSKGDKSPSP